ncbi:MAG: DUF2207 domain-containing protein [Patescibacteria group bacterium]|nr:DUF2207 domain-containing protein [Patescibacteria group bacterium]
MKKILVTIFCMFLFIPFFDVHAENIVHFNADIVINPDATVRVTEKITYNFGELQRHGIYRDIPVKYTTNSGNKYTAQIDDIVVTNANGKKVTFVVSKEGNNKRIKIGDANKTITGRQQYNISYTVHDAITYFDDPTRNATHNVAGGHQEFYWNVTGSEWPVSISTVTATVTSEEISQTDCFVGGYGSTQKCDSIGTPTERSGKMQATFAHNSLKNRQGMTVVVGMPMGTVYQPSTIKKIIKFMGDNWILFIPFFVLFFMWRRWLRLGKDPEGRGTVVPFYESPDNLSPAEVGIIIDEKVHSHDISALMINLAIKGCIHIRKEGSDYIFTKIPNVQCDLVSEEQMLYESIFEDNKTEVSVSSLKNNFYKDFAKISKNVVNTIIEKGYYAKNPSTVRATYMSIGGILLFVSFFIIPIFGGAAVFTAISSGIIIMAFGYFMPRRTKKGAIAREQILGLKMYMETAEKDRINFHNAPEKNPKQFEKLLPYAMALGVEKKWAEQFKDIYNSQPEWYEGSEAFSTATFANSMHSLGSKTASAMVSQPSSASSGSSGFSGGGSGGGFGGGGGGSW